MKIRYLAAGLAALAIACPAAAQTAPDDLHCFMLGSFFAKAAKDPRSKSVAGQSALFYLGRLEGRVDQRAIGAIIREHPDPKVAGTQMLACAQRVARAEQNIQAIFRSVAPKPVG